LKVLQQPPPKLLRAFEIFIWSMIYTICAFALLLIGLLVVLMIAVFVGWIGSLVS
jgi:hypothetical protein